MKYVIKNKRQKEYLYYLGFNCEEQKDKYSENKIYLFEKTDLLLEAIGYYTVIKNKQYKKQTV